MDLCTLCAASLGCSIVDVCSRPATNHKTQNHGDPKVSNIDFIPEVQTAKFSFSSSPGAPRGPKVTESDRSLPCFLSWWVGLPSAPGSTEGATLDLSFPFPACSVLLPISTPVPAQGLNTTGS